MYKNYNMNQLVLPINLEVELFAMYLFLLNCRKNIGVSPLDVAGIFD